MNTVRLAAIASSILIAAGATVSVNAQSVTDTVKVKVTPYELTTTDGRSAALERIQRAAAQLCTPDQPLYSRSARNSCEAQVAEQMIRQTGNSALYAQWTHKGTIETAMRN